MTLSPDVLMESRMRWKSHVRFGGRRRGDHRLQSRHRRLAADPASGAKLSGRSQVARSSSGATSQRSAGSLSNSVLQGLNRLTWSGVGLP